MLWKEMLGFVSPIDDIGNINTLSTEVEQRIQMFKFVVLNTWTVTKHVVLAKLK